MILMLNKSKKFLKAVQLKNKQRHIEKQYNEHGLTDEVLEAQVQLNVERNKHDIPDSSNFVYEDFVQ